MNHCFVKYITMLSLLASPHEEFSGVIRPSEHAGNLGYAVTITVSAVTDA